LLDDGELPILGVVIWLISVLSAVDAHTAHAIMENCLTGSITAGRTILLVSHHTALVAPGAAFIVALDNVSVTPSSDHLSG
jgi:ABC-type lipoprotein export system ATPase subunit